MEAFSLSPSSKGRNLGQVMSGQGHDDDGDDDAADDEPEAVLAETDDGASVGRPDDHPGKSYGPPEKDRARIKPRQGTKRQKKGKGRGKP
jgi:hypothetical protein